MVLDAGVLIALLNPQDVHHATALDLLELKDPPYAVHTLTAAEVLVGPARVDLEAIVWQDLTDAGVIRADLGPTEHLTLARLRAQHQLKMSDTCALATAEQLKMGLVAFDGRLAKVADSLGLLHASCPRF